MRDEPSALTLSLGPTAGEWVHPPDNSPKPSAPKGEVAWSTRPHRSSPHNPCKHLLGIDELVASIKPQTRARHVASPSSTKRSRARCPRRGRASHRSSCPLTETAPVPWPRRLGGMCGDHGRAARNHHRRLRGGAPRRRRADRLRRAGMALLRRSRSARTTIEPISGKSFRVRDRNS